MMKRIIALLLALILTVGLLPTVALAADAQPDVQVSKSDDNLNLVKTIKKAGENYTVTLESWATGAVTTETTPMPLDIILVLDESGSMSETFSSKQGTYYEEIKYYRTNQNYYKWSKEKDGIWYKDTDNNYYKVTVQREQVEDFFSWHYKFTYTYSKNGTAMTIGSSERKNTNPGYTFYRQYTGNVNITKREALVEAATNFADSVYKEAMKANGPDHRIAVVTYSGDASIKTGTSASNALVSVKTGLSTIKSAINGLETDGGTYINKGIRKANSIFEKNPIAEEGKRARVMIVFTDGAPGRNGIWCKDSRNYDTHEIAQAAIKEANTAEQTYKATVYTIGIFQGANVGNPKSLPTYTTDVKAFGGDYWDDNEKAKATANSNRFMHLVSSNYPDATSMTSTGNYNAKLEEDDNNTYYLAAASAGELSDVFTAISSSIKTDTTELNETATIIDNIPGNFTIPVEAQGIKVYTAKCAGKTGETLSWKERQASNLKPTTTTNTTTGVKSVSVTGFDYSDEWCGLDENNQPHGSKLIIEFTISHNNYGGTQPTNAGASIKDKENKDVITVDNPSVPVTITEPSITGASENKIYDGEGINVIANIKAAADTLVTGANMGKNQFVTITVAVKVDKDTTYTYTIPAGEEFGSWGTTTPTLTTGKDVNTYEYDLTITYKDATLKTDTTTPAEPKTASAKATYTITPAQVTLTSETASKDYDGTALTKPEVTVGGAGATVFKNEVTDIKANGSVIDPGPAVTNAITYTPGANFKATNYNISKSEGKLSINDIAGPTNLPKVNVYCTNGVANHQESTGNTLKNNTYTSVVSKNAEGKYICTITLTDKNSYINDYNASTSATHTSDATRKDFTAIVLYYDTVNKAWPAPIVNFALFVKCDTPTVTVTYTWDGLDSNDFDETHLAPTGPNDATPDKGSDYEVNDTFYSGYTVEDKNGVRYKFSGWSTDDATIENGQIKNIQTNVTLTGTWTKLGSGTFDLTDKIFKSFTLADGSRKIPAGTEYTFAVDVTPYGETQGMRHYGDVKLNNVTGETLPSFNFNNVAEIECKTPGTYTYLVEEAFDRGAHPDGIVDKIHYDTKQYLLTISVENDLTVKYGFADYPQTDGEAVPKDTITFRNSYFEDPNADIVTLDLSKYVTKTFESRHGKSATETFEARVEIWVKNPEIIVTAAEENAIAVYDSDPVNGTVVYDGIGTVKLSTGEKASFTFATNPKLNRKYAYAIRVTEVTGNNTDVEYDKTEYESRFGFYDTKEIQWLEGTSNFSFTNTYTGIDDYYPIIIPTIINKDTGMLNKTDHFAYVIGYPDGTVHPNGQITRAEVATIFFRLLRDEVRDGAFTTSNTYSDVAYGKWYNNPISTMSALGIITGYPDGTFKPNKPITRAEFAAIAARFDETQSGKSATFSDVIGHWAAKEIGIAYYNDWIKGYPDGTFKPDQNITRAEAMTLINRVLERKPESPADLLTNMNKWTDNMDTSKWYYLDVQEATNSHGYTRKTFNYELWRQMLPDPDWSRYER